METKDILEYLGIEAKDMDELKSQFPTKYFTENQVYSDKELLGKFTGKTLKKIKDNILKNAREMDIPLTQHEFDDAPLEDVVKTLKTRQSETFTTKIKELQSQVGKTGEEAIKPYLEKISKYEQSLADEMKAKKEISAQFDQFKQESEGKIKSTRIDYFKKDLMTSIDYDPVAMKDDLKRKGWESHIAENFRFDFDEHDQPIIMDKTGSKIKNPKKADEWLSPKDVLTGEAERLGLTKKNQQGGNPVQRQPFTPQTQIRPQTGFGTPQPEPPGLPKRKLAPGMEQYTTR